MSHHAQTSSGKGLPSHFWNMNIYITFTCMQSELQCIRLYIYCQYVCSLGTEPRTFCAANAMLYHWATGTLNTKHQQNWTFAQWSNVLFSDESKYCISFGNQGPRVWRKSGENPCCLKSSVKFPQSVMIWAAMSSAGVGPLCFLKSTVNAAIYQDILEHFMLRSADKLYGDADFIFQQDLAPAHTAKGTKSWFNDHGVAVLNWPANSSDLNPIENPIEGLR